VLRCAPPTTLCKLRRIQAACAVSGQPPDCSPFKQERSSLYLNFRLKLKLVFLLFFKIEQQAGKFHGHLVHFELNFMNQCRCWLLKMGQKQAVEKAEAESSAMPEWRVAMIDLFVNMAQLVGLPKSIGQIYGYLYSAFEPATMDQVIEDLGISKGSASQGLKFLRQMGAAKVQFVVGDRRDHFVAEDRSKKLIGGFIKEELQPALEDGIERVALISSSVEALPEYEKVQLKPKVEKLEGWHKRLKLISPMLVKMMGGKA